jgi:hypothetical protein
VSAEVAIFDIEKISEGLKAALSAAGVYKLALAAVCGVYYYVAKSAVVPGAETWELRAAFLGALLFGALWIASAINAMLKLVPPKEWILYYVKQRKERTHVQNYIASMTPKEREIIGYLIEHNQKVFTCPPESEDLSPLVSQRIVVPALQPGQMFNADSMPFVVLDNVWTVLLANRNQFPSGVSVDEYGLPPWRSRDWV